ncbi:hypothetical protein [Haloplanus sp. C73]|uniref:hypothetical protein n=1 Tax=Haloplanus sp. C73 TaxID=3421641 RepID=UPI003EB8C44F
MRRSVTILLAAALATFVLGNVVMSGHAAATLDGDVEVISQTCDDGAVTALDLHIIQESAPSLTVTPHVWSSRQHVQFTWEPASITVYDGGTNVTISVPDERAYIEGDRAQVWISAGQQRSIENFKVRQCS